MRDGSFRFSEFTHPTFLLDTYLNGSNIACVRERQQ